jgi:hypothetical protein
VSLTHKSYIGPRLRACAFWADPRGALVSAFVDRRDKGEGGERKDGGGECRIWWQFTVRRLSSFITSCLSNADDTVRIQVP